MIFVDNKLTVFLNLNFRYFAGIKFEIKNVNFYSFIQFNLKNINLSVRNVNFN